MIIIEMLTIEPVINPASGVIVAQSASIEITDEVDGPYQWTVGDIPAGLSPIDAKSHLDSRADELWAAAKLVAMPADVLDNINQRMLLKALVSLLLEEVNVLRANGGLPPRTKSELITGLKSKLGE
jgi:hypothetical protein